MRFNKFLSISVIFIFFLSLKIEPLDVSSEKYLNTLVSTNDPQFYFESDLKNYTTYQDIELKSEGYFPPDGIRYVLTSLPNTYDFIYQSDLFEYGINNISETYFIDIESLNLNLILEKQYYYLSFLQYCGTDQVINDDSIRVITIEKESLECETSINNSIFELNKPIISCFNLISKTNNSRFYSNQSIQYYITRNKENLTEKCTIKTNMTGSISIIFPSFISNTIGNYTFHILVEPTDMVKVQEFEIKFQVIKPTTDSDLNHSLGNNLLNSLITFSTVTSVLALVYLKRKSNNPKTIALRKIKI